MTPHIAPGAVVYSNATVHPGAWIGDAVEIGPNAVVAPGAVLGFTFAADTPDPVRIGEGVRVGPNVYIEPGVTIEAESQLGSGTCIRRGTHIARGVHVGERCLILGNCRIDEHASLMAEVHVCEYAHLRAHCQLMPGVVLLNDAYPPTALSLTGPVIGECAVLGVKCIVWPGVTVGYHAVVAALSVAKHDVPDYVLVRGRPAKCICDVRRIRMKLGDKWVYPYPWMRHNMEGDDITRPFPINK